MGADRGRRKADISRSRSRRKRRRRRAEESEEEHIGGRSAAPANFALSGLLDAEEDDQPAGPSHPVRRAPGPQPSEADLRARRSRSRDQEVGCFAGERRAGDSHGGVSGGRSAAGPNAETVEPKEEPNFEPSGLLAMEDNSKNGVALKFTCPPEARKPTMKWRLYIFTKQFEEPKVVHVHRKVGYLFGRDRRVVDIPTDHLTCSTQHAVLHHRLTATGEVKPYIMDLESTNGTFLNGNRLESARYYEMKERDVLKFGMSTREFVLLHAGSANFMEIDPSKLKSDSE